MSLLRRLHLPTGLVGVLSTIPGCSSFERDWKAAGEAPPGAAAGTPAGRWQGTWKSEVTGHQGELRAIVTPQGEGTYATRYRARYACCFKFEYTVLMSPAAEASPTAPAGTPEGGGQAFRGNADLGWLAGGVYTYEGHVAGSEFAFRYGSRRDRGTFAMTRVPPDPPPAAR